MMPQLWQTDLVVGMTLQDLHEKMIAFAESHFERKGGVPFLWMVYDGSHLMWVKTLWEDDREKELSANFMRKLIAVSNAKSYSFLTEAWMTVLAKGEKKTCAVKDMPAHRRDDVMTVTTHARDGNFLYTKYLVTLSQPKNFLGPRQDNPMADAQQHGGQMWNLFAPPIDLRRGEDMAIG